jgi:hypothetical protein
MVGGGGSTTAVPVPANQPWALALLALLLAAMACCVQKQENQGGKK